MFGTQKDPSKTEKATPKRVSKQRAEGNVPKSQELGKAVSLLGGMSILYAWIGPMSEEIKKIFRHFLSHAWEFDPNPENVYSLTLDLMVEVCKITMPVLLTLAFLSMLAQRLQVGKLWTTKVSPAASMTDLPSCWKRLANLPMVVVLPTPLTPTIRMT